MPLPLATKTAIVTGSSRGIGAAIAKALASRGAKVIVNYTSRADAAQEVVGAIEAGGGQAFAVRADVGDPAQARDLFDRAEARFGKVHILVNNAGVFVAKPLAETSDEDLDRILRTNVRGVFNTLREAANRLADGGRIINVSSTVTRMLLPGYSAYAASKGAVEQLARVFAKEIGTRGITVNAVSPGPTHTELFLEGKSEEVLGRMAELAALGRIGEPEDIARVVAFLASEDAGWISGQVIGANGGAA